MVGSGKKEKIKRIYADYTQLLFNSDSIVIPAPYQGTGQAPAGIQTPSSTEIGENQKKIDLFVCFMSGFQIPVWNDNRNWVGKLVYYTDIRGN